MNIPLALIHTRPGRLHIYKTWHTLLKLSLPQKLSDTGDYNLTAVGNVKSSETVPHTTAAPKKTSPLLRSAKGPSAPTVAASPPPPGAVQPFSNYVNLVLCDLQPGQGRTGAMATILFANPAGVATLSLEAFTHNVSGFLLNCFSMLFLTLGN